MRLVYYEHDCNSLLVPEEYRLAEGYKVLAVLTKEPPKEGGTYLVPFNRVLKRILYRYREGEFRPLFQIPHPPVQSEFVGKPLVEFPTYLMTPAEIPAVVADVIANSPGSNRLIRPLVRQMGIPLPPESQMTSQQWVAWILET